MNIDHNNPRGWVYEDKLKNEFPNTDFTIMLLMMKLGITFENSNKILHSYFSEFDLTKGKFNVLMLLYWANNEREVTLSEIAKELNVTKSTITGLVDGLETKQFIARNNKLTDRRKTYINITSQGIEFVKEFLPDHVKRMSSILSGFSKEEMDTLSRLTEKINANLEVMK